MDELSASGVQCVALAGKFTKLLQEGQTKALDPLVISLVVNNLQNSTLQAFRCEELGSLLVYFRAAFALERRV